MAAVAGNRNGNVIGVGFTALLLLWVVLLYLWLTQISDNNRLVAKVMEQRSEIQYVHALHHLVMERANVLKRVLLLPVSDDQRKKEMHRYLGYQARATTLWANLLSTDLYQRNLSDWKVLQERFERLNSLQSEIEQAMRQRSSASVELIKRLIQLEDEINRRLLANTDKINFQIGTQVKFSLQQQRNTFLMVLILGAAALLFGVIIAIMVWRAIVNNERDLTQARVDAQRANEAKSLFLANMSHEIRTPLTSIIGYAESMQDDQLNESERIRSVSTILRSGRHLLRIINDILDLSKIESNRLDVECVDVSIPELIADVESIVRPRTKTKGLEFRFHFNFPLPLRVQTDPTRVKQILINVCDNAVKFTDSGAVDVYLSYVPEDGIINCVVQDTGIGMSESELARVFKPFAQADASTTRRFGGTGLGLTIARLLAQKLGGDLTCTSSKGYGSTFRFYFSVGSVAEVDLASDQEAFRFREVTASDVAEPARKLSGHILLAEDSEDIQHLVSMLLGKAGLQVTVVGDGRQAVERAMVEDFDLVLMDMHMPVMDGMEAMRLMRKAGLTLPIVALTANALKSDIEKYLAGGFDRHLAKPIDKRKLFAVLSQMLSGGNGTLEEPVIDAQTYSHLVEQFQARLPFMIEELNRAQQNRDFESVQNVAHKLKGLGGSFGYAQLSEVASSLERAVIKGDYDTVDGYLQEIKSLAG